MKKQLFWAALALVLVLASMITWEILRGTAILLEIAFGLGVTAGLVYAISRARTNTTVNAHWQSFALPVIGIFVIHLSIWWLQEKFWWEWAQQNGFVLSQVLVVLGIYMFTLGGKTLKMMGGFIAGLGAIIVLSNINSSISKIPEVDKHLTQWKEEMESEKKAEQWQAMLLAEYRKPFTNLIVPPCNADMSAWSGVAYLNPKGDPDWKLPHGMKVRLNQDPTQVLDDDPSVPLPVDSRKIGSVEFCSRANDAEVVNVTVYRR